MECSSRTPFSFLRGTAHWSGGSAFSGSALPNPLCSEKSIPPWANPTRLSFLFTCPQSPWAFRDMSFPTFPSAAFSDLSQGTVIHGLGDHSPHVHLNLPICELLRLLSGLGQQPPLHAALPLASKAPNPTSTHRMDTAAQSGLLEQRTTHLVAQKHKDLFSQL